MADMTPEQQAMAKQVAKALEADPVAVLEELGRAYDTIADIAYVYDPEFLKDKVLPRFAGAVEMYRDAAVRQILVDRGFMKEEGDGAETPQGG